MSERDPRESSGMWGPAGDPSIGPSPYMPMAREMLDKLGAVADGQRQISAVILDQTKESIRVASQVDRINDDIADVRGDVAVLTRILRGDGNGDAGLIARVGANARDIIEVERGKKYGWQFWTAVVVAAVGVAGNVISAMLHVK